MSDLTQLLADVRQLTNVWMDGGPEAIEGFRDLADLLLRLTVMDPSSYVTTTYNKRRWDAAALGGPAGTSDPVLLNDGRYLRIAVSLFVDRDDTRGYLKVRKASYQYQADRDEKDWIYRYDYLRQPGPEPQPAVNLQVNGDLRVPDVLDGSTPLGRIHFPAGRISLEAVIRLLADQFHVPTNEDREVWRWVLTGTEAPFHDAGDQPMSAQSGRGATLTDQ